MTIPDTLLVIAKSSKTVYLIKKYSKADEFEITVGCTEDKELANKIVNEMNDFINNVQVPISWDTWDMILNTDSAYNADMTINVESLYANAQLIVPGISKQVVEEMAAITDFEYDIIQDYFYYVEETIKLENV